MKTVKGRSRGGGERKEKEKSHRYLEGMALDHHGDVAVEALQPLLVQTLQDIVAKVWDRHLEGLGHGAPTHTTNGSWWERKKKEMTQSQGRQSHTSSPHKRRARRLWQGSLKKKKKKNLIQPHFEAVWSPFCDWKWRIFSPLAVGDLNIKQKFPKLHQFLHFYFSSSTPAEQRRTNTDRTETQNAADQHTAWF